MERGDGARGYRPVALHGCFIGGLPQTPINYPMSPYDERDNMSSPEANGTPSCLSSAFRGIWLPPEIFPHLNQLTKTEILLLIIVESLVRAKNRGCWANNRYLAQRMDVTPLHISQSIQFLHKSGLLIVKNKHGKRFLETCWSIPHIPERKIKKKRAGMESSIGPKPMESSIVDPMESSTGDIACKDDINNSAAPAVPPAGGARAGQKNSQEKPKPGSPKSKANPPVDKRIPKSRKPVQLEARSTSLLNKRIDNIVTPALREDGLTGSVNKRIDNTAPVQPSAYVPPVLQSNTESHRLAAYLYEQMTRKGFLRAQQGKTPAQRVDSWAKDFAGLLHGYSFAELFADLQVHCSQVITNSFWPRVIAGPKYCQRYEEDIRPAAEVWRQKQGTGRNLNVVKEQTVDGKQTRTIQWPATP